MMTWSNSILVLLVVVSSTTILYSCEAKIPNTPDYYNYEDVYWDNGKIDVKYDDNAYEVASHIIQEEDKYDALIEEERKNEQSKVNKIVRDKSVILTGTIQRTIQKKSGLPFDICYFHVDVLRSICAVAMQFVETSTEPNVPVYNDHLDALLDEYDYGCEPMTTLKRKQTRNAIYCPFKLQYNADSNRPEFVKLSYVPGFYISASRFDANVLYLFKPKKENFRRANAAGLLMLEPFAEMSGIALERGSRLLDFSRAFMKWK